MDRKLSSPTIFDNNPIGYVTFKRTYARDMGKNKEEYEDTINRCLDSCQKDLNCNFSDEELKRLRYYLYTAKGLFAGRFFWQLGTNTVQKHGLLSLQNCAAVAVNDPIKPFAWGMNMLMLGCGVGFNIQREYVYEIPKILNKVKIEHVNTFDCDYVVPDNREGWVDLLKKTLEASFVTGASFTFTTKAVRPKGSKIAGFGGEASGPESLIWGITEINKILNARAKKKLRSIDAGDIANIIGFVVVSGNVRRSAELLIGDYDDIAFLNMKRWDLGSIPKWRSMSNNSVACSDTSKLPDEFWAGYQGKGEPYGLCHLKNCRTQGRTGDAKSFPDVIALNPCVSGDTDILTIDGYKPIKSLVGQEISVWNGFEWSTVTPRVTGHNQQMLLVTLSNGRKLRCTKAHKWVLAINYCGGQKRVTTEELTIGDKLIKTEYPVISQGFQNLDAYVQGFYSGDGECNTKDIWLYSTKYMCRERLGGTQIGKEYPTDTDITRKLIRYKNMQDKTFIPFLWNLQSRLNWFAGLLDSDGTELKEGVAQISSVDKDFLLNVQKMLTLCGVSCKVTKATDAGKRMLPSGNGKKQEYDCKELSRICIGSKQIQFLQKLGMKCERLYFNKYPNRDASRFVQVVSIEDSGVEDTVYCFTENKRNLGCFDGVVTGQCAEQPLEMFETCCLSEIILCHCDSYEEALDVLKLLYRVNKHSLSLFASEKDTEAVVHKNYRMGISPDGFMQYTKEQKDWMPKLAKELESYDKEYSKERGFPESVSLLTVKPSGSLSLLAGVSAGCHPSFAPYYIRRIRFSESSPILEKCRDANLPIEPQINFDGSPDHSTLIVSFPCRAPKNSVFAKDMTAIDQLESMKWLQANWSDNAVSCTIYYKLEELPAIKKWLNENYKSSLKGVSFLLHKDHGFIQAPLQEITEEEFIKLNNDVDYSKLQNIKSGDELLIGSDCDGGACPIR